jgi:Protein of unknown function (DUF1214)
MDQSTLDATADAQGAIAAAAQEWRSYLEPLLEQGEQLVARMAQPEDPQLRREMYRFLFAGIAMGYMGLFVQDGEHPDFWPNLNMAFNWGNPNPDDAYYGATLEGDGVYKLSGYRGTVRIIDFQIGGGDFYPRGGKPGPAYSHYDLDTLEIGEDGSFEVILSKKRPDGYTGNWWELDPRSTYMLVRQRSYDWATEVDGRLAIERVDRPAIRPRPSTETLEWDLRQIAVWASSWTNFMLDMVQRYKAAGLINKFDLFDYGDEGGWLGSQQWYVAGMFELEPGEALLYETEVPEQCRYWNITVNDPNWSAIDYVQRQSSLNGFTARIDNDGKFRAVICSEDPGVPNWLDAAGYQEGVIFGRWKECSSYPRPEAKRVPLAELRDHLPADTPHVSPQERDAVLRLRRRSAQMRKRW